MICAANGKRPRSDGDPAVDEVSNTINQEEPGLGNDLRKTDFEGDSQNQPQDELDHLKIHKVHRDPLPSGQEPVGFFDNRLLDALLCNRALPSH